METLTFVKRDTTDKEGNALKTKDGRAYTRMSIKVDSKGDRYISGFGNKDNADWKVGDQIDITITEAEKTDKEGRPYLNFVMPKKEDKVLENTELILNKLVGLQLQLNTVLTILNPKKEDYPEMDEEPAF